MPSLATAQGDGISVENNNGSSDLLSGVHRLQWAEQPELIDQIVNGVKTATVSRLDWLDGYDDYTTALRIGAVYTVYDGEPRARCRVRLTGLELVRWGAIPGRLWRRDPATTGETSLAAFIGDHEAFFDHPDNEFEFVAVYFDALGDQDA